jgi:RimJ/RimL family protein N-acetyltransferase
MNQVFPCDGDLTQLKGLTVYLEPAREEDRELIRPLAKDQRLWEFTKTLMIDDTYNHQFDIYFDEALRTPSLGGQAFIIRSAGDGNTPRPGEIPLLRGTILGMTRFFNVEWKDRRLEIGHTWYIPAVWGKIYNKECKLLLLQYAFEQQQFSRVEFRVAHQNIRSQKAVEKIGGLKEGVLRKFAIRNDGSRRDTVVFSIIDDEWPEKKQNLQEMVRAGL